jgi:hypothetical protein
MSAIGRFLDKIRRRRAGAEGGAGETSVTPATRVSPPVIHGPFGDTTESARLQAAVNIRDNPEVYRRVLELLARQAGSEERALARMRAMYPEAFDKESAT